MLYNTTGVTTNGLAALELPVRERDEAVRYCGMFLTDPQTVVLSSAVLQRDRIAVDPDVLGGVPYVRGTRIPIVVILDGLGEGLTPLELIEHYPRLTLEDIRSASEYAAEMALWPRE